MNSTTDSGQFPLVANALEATFRALENPGKPILAEYKAPVTLSLLLFHGRKNPEQDMDDWGFDAPLIRGITSMSCTYGHIRFHFIDEAATDAAIAQTGWRRFDHNCLEATMIADLVTTKVAEDVSYYGDYHLHYEK